MVEGDMPGDQRLRPRVDMVEMLGAEALVYLQTDAEPVASSTPTSSDEDDGSELSRKMHLVARIAPRAVPQRGELVELGYEPGSLHFFDPETGHALNQSR